MTLPVPRRWRLSSFVCLSLADLALTCWLVGRPGGPVYEANPAAAWALGRWGWVGLAAVKAASVGLALAVLVPVAWRRPRVADRVLGAGCVVLAGVVGYSALVAVPAAEASDRSQARLDEDGRRLEAATRPRRAAARFTEGVYHDLRAGRPLPSAAREVLAADPPLIRWLFPDGIDRAAPDAEAWVAARLVDAVATGAGPADAALVRRLRGEYRAHYGAGAAGATAAR